MRSLAYFLRSARPCSLNSQPTCAWKSPRRTPMMPSPTRCGERGAPSSSECAWGLRGAAGWLRWWATEGATGPWTAIWPSPANVYSSQRFVANDRWVNSRWKPTVMPKPVSRYMTTMTRMPAGPVSSFQKKSTVRRKATGGIRTASRFTTWFVRDMELRLGRKSRRLLSAWVTGSRHALWVADNMGAETCIADVLRPVLPETADEIVAVIRAELPAYD